MFYILALTLSTVAKGGGSPSKEKTTRSSLSVGELEAISKGLVLFLIDLETTLHQIKGCDGGVSKTTGEETAEAAESVILGATKLTGVLISGRSLDHSFLGHLAFD